MRKVFFIENLFVIALFALVLSGCGRRPGAVQASSNAEQTSYPDSVEMTEEVPNSDPQTPSWVYSKNVDDLSGEVKSISAVTTSENEIEYETRFHNSTKLALGVCYGYMAGSSPQNYIVLSFAEDKIGYCRISDFQGQGFLCKFDDGPIDDTWSFVDNLTDDGKGLVLYNKNKVANFLAKLKKSKKVRIQIKLDNVGMKTFDFNTEGLDWNH